MRNASFALSIAVLFYFVFFGGNAEAADCSGIKSGANLARYNCQTAGLESTPTPAATKTRGECVAALKKQGKKLSLGRRELFISTCMYGDVAVNGGGPGTED